jgi:hypothetical protein
MYQRLEPTVVFLLTNRFVVLSQGEVTFKERRQINVQSSFITKRSRMHD